MFRRPSLPAFRALTALVLAASWLAAPAIAADDKLRQNEQALGELRGRIGALQQKLERDAAERDSAQREVQAVERRIVGASQNLAGLRQRIAAQQRKVRETQAQRAEAEAALQARRGELARQMRAAYVMGRQGQTQLLLNVDDTQMLGRMLTYYDYLQRAQLKVIAAISARAEELQRLADRLQQEQDELEQLRKEQESAVADLQKNQAERSTVLAELKTRLASDQDDLEQLKADERDIRKLIESLKKALADLPPKVAPSGDAFTAQKGKLPWPLRGPLLARYGQEKSGGRISWNGHWIGGSAGAPVQAVARGRAVYVGWMHRYGLIVLVEHDAGYYTLYGHCQSAAVAVGDPVRAGQTIAAAGDTGGYDQSGVYFEIRKGTTAVDPRQWLAK